MCSILLPIVADRVLFVLLPRDGVNATVSRENISTFGFLYGTFPTAPTVFVFASQYNIAMEIVSYAITVVHVLMRDEKEGRKKQARSNKQQGKATQHTQGMHTFPKKNELPRVELHVQSCVYLYTPYISVVVMKIVSVLHYK